MSTGLLFDLALMTGVLVLAYRAIHAETLFAGVVLYIAFGLLLAISWLRLEAPDVALAEAAMGAGVTGALLLDAAGQLRSGFRHRWFALRAHGVVALATLGLAAILIGTMVGLAGRSPGLGEHVRERIPESGVEHPVTAVLLNFRGYDTLLEVAVLFVAALGVLALCGARLPPVTRSGKPTNRITIAAASLLVPAALLVSGYLLWQGAHGVGGAFQAGAVGGAAGIMLLLVRGLPDQILRRADGVRFLLSFGFVVFLAVGIGAVVSGRSFLEYPPLLARPMILAVEAAVSISIAVTLVLLFVGARAGISEKPGPEGKRTIR